MKGATCASLMVLGALVLFIGVDAGNLCRGGDDCEEDECCLKLTNFITRCTKMKAEGDGCLIHQLTNLFQKDIYQVTCPCKEGLKCVGKDGIVGEVAGKCQINSGEEPSEE